MRKAPACRSALIGTSLLVTMAATAAGQNASQAAAFARSDAAWTMLDDLPAAARAGQPWIRPTVGQALRLDLPALTATLAAAPQEGPWPVRESSTLISLPRPDGVAERFAIVESSLLEPGLQERYPQIRTYLGQGHDDPAATLRCTVGPLGFQATVLRAGSAAPQQSAWHIDAATRTDTAHYTAYWHGAVPEQREWVCETESRGKPVLLDPQAAQGRTFEVLRNEFIVAIAATGEYTQWISAPNPPSVELALNAIVQTLSQVNLVLERDGPVRLYLAMQNDRVIYTDGNTDPYWGSKLDMLDQNDDTLDAEIGENNYSLGHVFHLADMGGLATLACVCEDNKGRGVSTSLNPSGAGFVQLVAHEIGHQLGAEHTFNAICGDQRNGQTAYEPGDGNTIMSYAGVCDANPPGTPILMYSFMSMLQIAPTVVGADCVYRVATGNYHPGATPGVQGPYLLPTNTPFRLGAPAAENYEFGEVITYSIEQADLGAAGQHRPDTGNHEPLMRVLAPDDNNERWIPDYNHVLNGTPSSTEYLPQYSRDSLFVAVLRDNVAGAGGWGMGDIQLQFVQVPFPGFQVLAPAGGASTRYCGGEIIGVTWNVAGTNEDPINAATVDILLSTDNGQNFPWTLAADFPNVGAALVPLPYVPTTQARIKVQADGGRFYAVNQYPFEVATAAPTITAQPVDVAVCPGGSFTLSVTPGGGMPRHFQWYRNGAPVTGATEATYQVFGAGKWQTGDYHVVISNGCGKVASDTVRVQIGISIDSEPVEQNPQPCETVVLSCAARGVGPLSFLWFRAGDPVIDDGRITGATTPALTFHGVRNDDEGFYFCRIWDACETTATIGVDVVLPTPTWTHVTASGPLVRHQLSTDLAYDAVRGVCVLYGGTSGASYLDDTWEWDGVEWIRKYPASNPGQRYGQELVWDSLRQKVLLFGGWSPNPFYDRRDVWEYDGTDWALVSPSSAGPPPAFSQQGDAAFDEQRGKMIVTFEDGYHPDPPTNRTWEFDSATGTWALTYQGVGPPHFGSPIAYDPRHEYTVGQAYTTQYNKYTWTNSDGTWTALVNNTPERYWPAMAYDSVRRRITLFGSGRSIGQPSAWHTDTYALEGINWTQILPEFHVQMGVDPFPPVAMAFDSRRRAMVVLGTNLDYSAPLDTWEYRYFDQLHIDRQPQGLVVEPGVTATFAVYAAGAGDLTYQWRHGALELVDGPGPDGSTIAGATTATLTITGVAAANVGAYQVEIQNACGTLLSDVAHLTIPAGPADVNVDGAIDILDAGVLQIAIGACAGEPDFVPAADIDHDGCVDGDDALLLLGALANL